MEDNSSEESYSELVKKLTYESRESNLEDQKKKIPKETQIPPDKSLALQYGVYFFKLESYGCG